MSDDDKAAHWPNWAVNARSILEESVAFCQAGHFRSAVHAAYGAFTLVCETGFRKHYSPSLEESKHPEDRLHDHAWRLTEVSKERPMPMIVYRELESLGRCRNRTAHKNYRTPEGQEVFQLLVAVALFLDIAGIPLSDALLAFVPPFVEQPVDEAKDVRSPGQSFLTQ